MVNMILRTLALSALLLISSPSVFAGEDFYPLDVGSRWEYSMEIEDSGAKMERKMEERCVGIEMINGKRYFKVVKGMVGGPSKQVTGYIRKGEDGVYAIDGRYPDGPEQTLMKLPLTMGTTWVNMTPSGKETTYRVEGRETVYVRGRRYPDTVKIHARQKTRNREYEGYSYYAPNVGQVKVVKRQKNDPSSSMKMELLAFEE